MQKGIAIKKEPLSSEDIEILKFLCTKEITDFKQLGDEKQFIRDYVDKLVKVHGRLVIYERKRLSDQVSEMAAKQPKHNPRQRGL